MPKTLVAKAEIQTDDRLAVVKAYRLMNKRAGEAKKANNSEQYEFAIVKMHELEAKAETLGFKIWVEHQDDDRIVTGHTYEKDYKPTPDSWNDYEEHIRKQAERNSALMARMTSLIDSSEIPENPEELENSNYDEDNDN